MKLFYYELKFFVTKNLKVVTKTLQNKGSTITYVFCFNGYCKLHTNSNSMIKKIPFLLLGITANAQELHHQMLSGQGHHVVLDSGIAIRQSIGQQSIIGTYTNNQLRVEQGFQQSALKMSTNATLANDIKITVYPNPFKDMINFQFSKPINETVNVTIFDVLGRTVYNKENTVSDTTLTIYNLNLADGEYIVKVATKNYYYTINLIKAP